MKNLLAVLLLTASLNGFAQQKDIQWYTDINNAITISQETKKPMLLFFTGSDWCGWCKKLVREVFDKDEFEKWARKNVILVELDFPRRTKLEEKIAQQNRKLQQMFGVRGYPTIWFVNPEKQDGGKINFQKLGSTGYVAGGPQKWIDSANQIISNK